MDPLSRRVARRYVQADLEYHTRRAPRAITPDQADDALAKVKAAADEMLVVIRKVSTWRKSTVSSRWRWKLQDAATEAAHKFFDACLAARPTSFPHREDAPAVDQANREVIRAASAVVPVAQSLGERVYEEPLRVEEDSKLHETMKIAMKTWAVDIRKVVLSAVETFKTYLHAQLGARPNIGGGGAQLDSVEEFEVAGLRFVVFDPEAAKESQAYAREAHRTKDALFRKGFGSVWYGTVVIISKELRQLSSFESAAYEALGYRDLYYTAGSYHSGSDEVKFTTTPFAFDQTLAHELGHRWWYKKLDQAQRATFNQLVRSNHGTETRELPSGDKTEEGELKPVSPVSMYGWSTVEEAFAEAFAHYVLGRKMDRDQLESFRSVLVKQAGETPVYTFPHGTRKSTL